MTETDNNRPPADDAGDTLSVLAEQELCRARGHSYRDPMHVHVCTIVLVDEPEVDEHQSHACYCGDWWHDR